MGKYFTMTLPNKKCDKNGMYKNYLLKRLATAYPELLIDGIDTEETPFSYQYIGPNDKIRFGATLYSPCDVAKYRKCTYCPYNEENYNLATQFELAMKKLDDYAKMQRKYQKPLYDFRLDDGTPVKEYNNFIQVGYRLIPKYNRAYILAMPKKEQVVINNLIVMINNSTEINTTLNV